MTSRRRSSAVSGARCPSTDKHVLGHTCTGLMTHTGSCRLQREPIIVARDVRWMAKAVDKDTDRYTSWEEEEPQTTQKEHSEHLSIEARVRRRGASQEWKSFQKTTLRPGERNVGEAKPHCRVKEESVGFSGRLTLPTKAPWTKILASGCLRTHAFREGLPICSTKTHPAIDPECRLTLPNGAPGSPLVKPVSIVSATAG